LGDEEKWRILHQLIKTESNYLDRVNHFTDGRELSGPLMHLPDDQFITHFAGTFTD
jgi:hypothetical protein